MSTLQTMPQMSASSQKRANSTLGGGNTLENSLVSINEVINSSTAKQRFSFSKSRRFTTTITPTCTEFTHNLPSAFGKRSPSFGVGQRFGAPTTKSQLHTPNPGTYTVKTSFENNVTMAGNMRTTSFKNCSPRRAHEMCYMPGQKSPRATEFVPGPGSYQYKNMSCAFNEAQKFTLKPRVKLVNDPVEITRKIDTPGPGHYRSIGISPIGDYKVSNIPNSRASAWSPAKGKRFKAIQLNGSYPEPATYKPSDMHSMGGQYITSNYRNQAIKLFREDTSPRKQAGTALGFSTINTPGPGTYILPSDFGFAERTISTADCHQSVRSRTNDRRNTNSQMATLNPMQLGDLNERSPLLPEKQRTLQTGNGLRAPPKFLPHDNTRNGNQHQYSSGISNTDKKHSQHQASDHIGSGLH